MDVTHLVQAKSTENYRIESEEKIEITCNSPVKQTNSNKPTQSQDDKPNIHTFGKDNTDERDSTMVKAEEGEKCKNLENDNENINNLPNMKNKVNENGITQSNDKELAKHTENNQSEIHKDVPQSLELMGGEKSKNTCNDVYKSDHNIKVDQNSASEKIGEKVACKEIDHGCKTKEACSEVKRDAEKELPDWFKMMISLTHGIQDGKELQHEEDITETFDIHGSTQAITVQTNHRLYQLILKRLHRLMRRKRGICSCAPNFYRIVESRKSAKEKKVNKLIEDILEPILEIDNVEVTCEDVNAVCHKGGVPVLHIKCSSCTSLYQVVAALNSPVFKENVARVKECLEQEVNENLAIDASITPECIQDIETHLRDQGIISAEDDFDSCESHPDKQAEVYCFEHNEICCAECATSKHSSCEEIKHVKLETNKHSVILGKVDEYNMRLQNEETPEENCDITASCTLSSGEIILADMNNKRLKRLDKDFKIVDYCDLPGCPRDVCYSKNKHLLAVTLFDPAIQFVDINSGMILKERVPLDHDCFGVAFYGDILYATDPMNVYMYNLDGIETGILYSQMEGNHSFCKIAVSEDGEKIYIAARDGGLVTIDKGGNHLSCMSKGDLSYVTDVCVLGDESLLVCNYRKHTVTRVNRKGKYQLGRIADRTNNMYMPQSLCFEKQESALVIGHLHDDFISVIHIN